MTIYREKDVDPVEFFEDLVALIDRSIMNLTWRS
jgi:hypothetical protein